MMMITEECHPEEVQAFATRRPADEGPTHYSPRGLAQTVAFVLRKRVPHPSSLGRGFPRLSDPRLPRPIVERRG
jgi:hypothetical protein